MFIPPKSMMCYSTFFHHNINFQAFHFQIQQGKFLLASLRTLKANNGFSNDVKNTIELLTQCIYIIIDYESKIVDIS